MKKNIFEIVCVFLFIALSVNVSNAQNYNYYYANNTMQYWTTDSSSANIIVKNLNNYNAIVANLNVKFENYSNYEIFYDDESDNIVIYCPELPNMNIPSLLNAISVNNDDISFFSFSKILDGNSRIWLRNDIYVKLSDTTKFQQYVIGMLSSYDVVSNNYEGNGEYRLVCSNEIKMMQLANRLHDSIWTIYSTPDFYSASGLSTNDELYSSQWALKNTGQNNGTPDIDINVEKAWSFLQNATGTLGSNIKVAVVDDGVEEHDDLYFVGGINKVLPGYTANGNGTGRPLSTGFHGEWCAGIISSEHNNIYVAGVAPDTYIVPIRIFRKKTSFSIPFANNPLFFSNKQIADAIRKAYVDFDVQIINCSWNKPDSDKVRYAIADAVTLGRNNKGCILVGSFGNDNANTFPSTAHPNTISVGAINRNGIKCSTSNFGQLLSVVAPGDNICTIDRMGSFGKTSNNYYELFGGTSAAAPHVSGVAALMLSANPNLTSGQVKTIIEQTAQKIRDINEDPDEGLYNYSLSSNHPNGTWNEYLGYGLVDAHKAVMQAYFYNYSVSGNSSVSSCDTYTYSIGNNTIPNGTTLTWTTSSNIEIVSGQHTSSITVRPIAYGSGWVKANFEHEDYTVTKTKNVNVTSGYTTCYNNYTASGSMTLGMNSVIAGTFTVSSGSTVTISSTVRCSPEAKIVIRPNGKLVVDGGTITNLCPDKTWNAIYVVGNYYQRQLAQHQGTLEIKNNSVIENSSWGIVTWNGTSYSTTGGIVQCTNSTFRNNGRQVEFYPYTNHNASNEECNNVSYFKNCNFTIDDNLFSSSIVIYTDMIKMSGVRGIPIRGCHFCDNRTGMPTRGNAIHLFGASANIKPSCSFGDYTPNLPCNCTGESRNTFSGFAKGIYAENTGTNYAFYVFKTDFSLCNKGIYSSAVNNYNVTKSNFNLSGVEFLSPLDSYGIYSINCSGYKIEENNLYTTNTSHVFCNTFGIHMQNSGTDVNSIYRNTFEKLEKGVYLQNNPGLQVSCNEFSDNLTCDISNAGSIPQQGTSSESAGNKFTAGVSNFTSNIALTYYHSGTQVSSNEYYPASTSNNVTKIPQITANDCESTICIVPIYPPINPPINPKSSSTSDDISLYESLQQMYESRLAEYTAAGYGFLLENFEENDADIVALARLKQDTLVSIRRTMAEIANRNIDAILQDTLIFDRESLNGWYNRINTTTAKYSLVNSYFEVGEYALARQELAAIPQRFALSTDELAEYDNFCQYQSLRESVYSSGRNYAQLTETEIAEMQTIAERNTGVSSAYANSVLCFFYGICRDEEMDIDFDIDAPMNNKSTMAVSEESVDSENIAIYVYPNPADEELNILLNVIPEGKTMIEFHDVAGRLVLSEEIKGNNTSINISSLKQGVYMYRIVNGDDVIARDRIVKE